MCVLFQCYSVLNTLSIEYIYHSLEKQMVWKSIVMFYSQKDVKRRFNHSHVNKVSAQSFARGYKKRIQLGKTLYRFPQFIKRKYFTLILKTMILTAMVNSVTGTEIFTIQKQPPEVFLKFKSKFHKIHGKTLMPMPLFK